MLKCLELVGFKSFADKTRFDFAPGVTGIVGPNGSGKSNVVDAVRWILGEQSAKSLRGGEMADVIFNGSASRKSLGLAEVTVTFDNTRRLLALDVDEVQLTRRVYRDGTGEYLVNGQMARLKDFKEMFLGSGAGAGGYTIIAQGRVDELLHSSTKDRREIFDEAAGISRFKAKKIETLRKLATVELNLTRSKDRLDSLDTQLRTLRMQAAKAQKHRDYSERLRELRVGLSAREYHELTAVLAVEQDALTALRAELAGVTAEAEQFEQQAKELDWAVTRGEESLRHHETRIADARQQIASFETTLKHERTTSATLESDLLKLGRQRAELGYRVLALEAEAVNAAAAAAAAEIHLAEEQQRSEAVSKALADIVARLEELDREYSEGQARQFDCVRQAGSSRAAADATLRQVERLQKEYTSKLKAKEQRQARRTAQAEALEALTQADADIQARLTVGRSRIELLNSNRTQFNEQIQEEQTRLEELRVRQGDLRGRIDVLEGLERSLEGLGAGVAAVWRRLNAESMERSAEHQMNEADELPRPDSVDEEPARFHPPSSLLGMVADLLTVPREIAPFVELALGEVAQRFVVRSAAVIDTIAAEIGELGGRVGFVPLVQSEKLPGTTMFSSSEHFSSSADTTSLSLASFVTCAHPDCGSLPLQLLGRVLLADSLKEARTLAARYPNCRIITRTGELLEADGSLTIGPFKSETGLVSRKSELRDLLEQYRITSELVAEVESTSAELRRQFDAIDGVIEAVRAEIDLLSDEAGGLLQHIARQRQQVESLDQEIELLSAEGDVLERQVREGESAWVAARQAAEEAEATAASLSARLAELKQEIAEGEAERDLRQEAHTTAQVAFSQAAAERDRARERAAQIDADFRKRKIESMNLSAVAHSTRGRLVESILAALYASAGQADAYREKESRERIIADLIKSPAAERAAREQAHNRLRELRHGWQEKQAAVHARELAVHDLTARRDTVAARIREDYGIELEALASEKNQEPVQEEATGDSQSPAIPSLLASQQEIDELKKKLVRLGSVNMEALEELTRIEAEFNALQAQHDDLNTARNSLQQVINAINADSRKHFTETLAAIRGYFQELFRKLFGGGQADIILEDESDVLESGIEITARPPGKELRALSLLSGGEKTLTAVALLLAIFRSKPSPFCILDEVDAALDEANTTRLAGVLREFLDRSQFIVITHKKRTMAAADRLWGVTMQESGISRLLPMRFEDWPEEEEQPHAQAA